MFEKTIEYLSSSDDPLCLPGVPVDAVSEPVKVVVSPSLADHHGIEVDAQGFPLLPSLETWHRLNNPQLFKEDEE